MAWRACLGPWLAFWGSLLAALALLPCHAHADHTLTLRTQVWSGAAWTYVPAPDTLTPARYEWQGGTYSYAPMRVNVRRAWQAKSAMYEHAGAPSGPTRLDYYPGDSLTFPWSYSGITGQYLVSLPDSLDGLPIEVRAARGYACTADTLTFNWPAKDTTVTLTVREVALGDSGWTMLDPWVRQDTSGSDYSITRADLDLIMQAEGLDALWLTDSDTTWTQSPGGDSAMQARGRSVVVQQEIHDGVWGYVLTSGTHVQPTVDSLLTAHLTLGTPTFLANRWYDRVDSLGGWSWIAGGHRVRSLDDTTAANGALETARDLMWSPHDASITRPDGVVLAEGLHGCPIGAYDSATQANARTYRDWRRLVYTGEVLPVLAGSGAGADTRDGQPPIGSWRTCVRTRPEYATELLPGKIAARAAYITSGPTFTRATLDGRELGRNVGILPGDTVTLAVGIHSALPVDTLRIWLNGDRYSTTTFSPAAHDTAWSTSITLYGLTEGALWFDLVASSTPSWSDPACGGRRYAVSAPWRIYPLNASELYTYGGGSYSHASADTIAAYYNALAWASAADSTEFNESAARIATETARVRSYWARPSGRTLKNGSSEFPYTNLETVIEGMSSGDTLYLHPGRYARPAATIDVPAGVKVRGWPGISRADQCDIVQGASTLPLFASTADNVTLAEFCVRGGTALPDTVALFEIANATGWKWRGLRIANFNLPDAADEGIFDLERVNSWTVQGCEFDSLDGGMNALMSAYYCTTGTWDANRVTRSTWHEDYAFALYGPGVTDITNSLWASLDARDNAAPGIVVESPSGRVSLRGCTFAACETHNPATQGLGVVQLRDATCDTRVTLSRCAFASCDSTAAVGFGGTASQADSLLWSLAYDVAAWPPAAGDTLGLVATDPKWNSTALGDADVYRVTSRKAINAAGVDQLGWQRAKEPNALPCALVSRFGTRIIGGAVRHPANTGRPFSEVEP